MMNTFALTAFAFLAACAAYTEGKWMFIS